MRYAVFVYYHYYPRGGWNDVEKLTDDLDEAKEFGKGQSVLRLNRVQIVDLHKAKVIEEW